MRHAEPAASLERVCYARTCAPPLRHAIIATHERGRRHGVHACVRGCLRAQVSVSGGHKSSVEEHAQRLRERSEVQDTLRKWAEGVLASRCGAGRGGGRQCMCVEGNTPAPDNVCNAAWAAYRCGLRAFTRHRVRTHMCMLCCA